LGRDSDGWKVSNGAPLTDSQGRIIEESFSAEAPSQVVAVHQFESDLRASEQLTASKFPPVQPVRPTGNASVFFGFGDASGSGFGQSLWEQGDDDIEVQYGLWDSSVAEQSSNFRELANHVLYIKQKVEAGEIPEGSELFLFTDNFVADRCFSRGTSQSRLLFELMLQLQILQMQGTLFIWLIWVAGT